MAENDKFDRKVDKHWRKTARHLRGRAPCEQIVDSIIEGTKLFLREHDLTVFPEFTDLVLEAVRKGDRVSPWKWQILLADCDDGIARILARLGSRLTETLTVDDVLCGNTEYKIASELICSISDHQVFSRLRQDLMKRENRNEREQREWERDLEGPLRHQGEKLLLPVVREGRLASRVPPRLTARVDTVDLLNTPLPVSDPIGDTEHVSRK